MKLPTTKFFDNILNRITVYLRKDQIKKLDHHRAGKASRSSYIRSSIDNFIEIIERSKTLNLITRKQLQKKHNINLTNLMNLVNTTRFIDGDSIYSFHVVESKIVLR